LPAASGTLEDDRATLEEFRKDRIEVKAEAEVVQGVSDFVEGIGNIGSTWVFEPSQNIKVVT